MVHVKRAYDEPAADDGCRVLVDRLWPRGLAKQQAAVDEWVKAVAPSAELRKWYGHDPARYPEFAKRYRAELHAPEGETALRHLRDLAGDGELTLLTATRDLDHAHTAVLERLLA
ncbi:DUF488 domain-containing protein [Dactylosporangium sp. CA-052675]|uniref:DUF488 domain-containing protein n=1 Tax=Dactylosporangium sp. CA-052675 TaxID=3239927 RepID=UPI003D8ADFA4